MLQKFAIPFMLLVVFAIAGCFVRDIFADGIIHQPTTQAAMRPTTQPASPLDFAVTDIDGKPVDLSVYRGKVVMIVNVASKCGFTPQYAGLETLYKTHADQGFVILGFPANNFNSQEPGSDMEIKAFCTGKYNVTFPIMSKVSVKGDDKASLYKFLTEPPTAGDFQGDIGWNFTKFIIDRHGNVIARFASKTIPQDPDLVGIVEKALAAK